MATIQVVLDKKLLDAADRAAKRTRQNRSALVRQALFEHLRRLEIRAQEEREREAYKNQPQRLREAKYWAKEAVWPAE